MKTQVIKLDQHDDATSVRDKMSWAKTERILLVFPARTRILDRRLDLHLLERYAATLGAQLAIVSSSQDQRRAAEDLKIPAFARVDLAQRKPWEWEKIPPRPSRRGEPPDLVKMHQEAFPREASWRSIFWLRFFIFTLAALAILAILSLFIPTASITLYPAGGLQNLTLNVTASRDVQAVNLAGSLPARVGSQIVEQSKVIPVSGVVALPQAKAHGMATFRNLTSSKITIPAGTVISTLSNPPVRFATTTSATVAVGTDKQVDIPIQAVDGGSAGNLPLGALVSFEGDLGTSLAVTNAAPTTGGSDEPGPIQTASDRTNLRTALLNDISELCSTEIQQSLATGDIYFPGTLDVSQVLSETYFPAEDQSAETLSLTMRVQCQAQYAAHTDLDEISQMSMNAALPGGYAPASPDPTILNFSTPLTGNDDITKWEMQIQRRIYATLDPFTVIRLSAGRKPADAVFRLKNNLSLAQVPVVQVKPDWWPWLPLIPFRIAISVGK